MARSASIAEIWRYPVKSMIGERLGSTLVNDWGVLGDRGWAVRDEALGGIRGAKKIGGLMQLAARYLEEPAVDKRSPLVEIALPDGSRVKSDDATVSERISEAVDHPVTLWPLQPAENLEHYLRGGPDSDDFMAELQAMFGPGADEPLPDMSAFPAELAEFESPPGTYFDAYPLSLLTTASLRSVAEAIPDSSVEVRRFRPNFLVDVEDGGYPEQHWIGRRVAVGDVEIEVTNRCVRCVMVTLPTAGLPRDRAVLRTLARRAGQNLGVYARILRAGVVAEGDELRVLD
jgi:uncharacterized protein YcbX